MTKRQREVLDTIARLSASDGCAPSYEEIGSCVGLKSLATVHKHISNLQLRGLIVKRFNQSRSIELTKLGKKAIGKKCCPNCGFEMRGAA